MLVVVTDGKDNNSRIKFRDLVARAREDNVLIYPVGMVESGEMFSGYYALKAEEVKMP